MSDLYDHDFITWSEQQATLLRRRASGELVNEAEVDYAHIAEELETLGGNLRRELSSRLRVLLMHLLKWEYQPDHRSRSWRSTIRQQRLELDDLLRDNPGMKPLVPQRFADVYRSARAQAIDETGLEQLPTENPFTLEQVLSDYSLDEL